MPEAFDLSSLDPADVPPSRMSAFHHYVDTWLLHEPAARALVDHAGGVDIREHFEALARDRSVTGLPELSSRSGPVAVIDVAGPLMKFRSSLFGGTSTVEIRRALRQAVRDETVEGIVLRVDSPGGTTAGTADLADDVARAAKVKPVVAFIEDLAASAAYWIASQAGQVVATETSQIGSIGVYLVVADSSARAEQAGIKVHLVRAGEYKGIGQPGVEVAEAELDYLQARVNRAGDFFVEAVARGRGLSKARVRLLADGRVHYAPEALGLGLIDAVGTFDSVVGGMRQAVAERRERDAMLRERIGGGDPHAPLDGTAAVHSAIPGAPWPFVVRLSKSKPSAFQALAAFERFESLLESHPDRTAALAAWEQEQAA